MPVGMVADECYSGEDAISYRSEALVPLEIAALAESVKIHHL
jgi:hypothetical protein